MDIDQQNKKLWNYYQTKARESFSQSHPRFDYLIGLIKRYKKRGSCLDIGIGDGYFLKQMVRAGNRCWGIDIDSKSILVNRKKFQQAGLRIRLKKGNINAIPFKDKTFGIVTASEVLEHLNNENLKKGIKEVRRCLKKGGIFVATVPADEKLEDNFCFCPRCNLVFHKWGHQQTFSRERLLDLFSLYFSSVTIVKRPTIASQQSLFENLKFRIKWLISPIYSKPFVGNFIIVAMK